jgi:hypothetical protein
VAGATANGSPATGTMAVRTPVSRGARATAVLHPGTRTFPCRATGPAVG